MTGDNQVTEVQYISSHKTESPPLIPSGMQMDRSSSMSMTGRFCRKQQIQYLPISSEQQMVNPEDWRPRPNLLSQNPQFPTVRLSSPDTNHQNPQHLHINPTRIHRARPLTGQRPQFQLD
ncbi:unnamed protein product [Pleuronectes platessa]|uniref:Uncharacterized protein n=1 Tax=Pleuronectes platessa TaxID=8262 RepID=A0A9N7YLL6_PLEPL|nr:unnamed protein product [Pleuronectes platessa]